MEIHDIDYNRLYAHAHAGMQTVLAHQAQVELDLKRALERFQKTGRRLYEMVSDAGPYADAVSAGAPIPINNLAINHSRWSEFYLTAEGFPIRSLTGHDILQSEPLWLTLKLVASHWQGDTYWIREDAGFMFVASREILQGMEQVFYRDKMRYYDLAEYIAHDLVRETVMWDCCSED